MRSRSISKVSVPSAPFTPREWENEFEGKCFPFSLCNTHQPAAGKWRGIWMPVRDHVKAVDLVAEGHSEAERPG